MSGSVFIMLRKVFCILLAVCLSVPLACPALAADTPDVVEAVYTHLRQDRRQTAAEKLTAYFEAVK